MTDAENALLTALIIIADASKQTTLALLNDGLQQKQKQNLLAARASLSMAMEQINKFKLD